MIDNRHLRFTNIDGIERRDLPVAAEIWLHDITAACWATRDIIKLATLFAKYIKNPHLEVLGFGEIERNASMEKNQVAENCRVLLLFGTLDTFDCDGPRLKASLNLSFLQRLRVLEVRVRFAQLKIMPGDHELPWHDGELRWSRACNVGPDGNPIETTQ